MNKNNFKNSCDNYKQKLMKDLDSIRDHALSNKEFKKSLNINEWDKTIDLEKLAVYHYLAMACIYKYTKPRSYKKHSKLIEKIEKVLHIWNDILYFDHLEQEKQLH